jgi:hypothetical protein
MKKQFNQNYDSNNKYSTNVFSPQNNNIFSNNKRPSDDISFLKSAEAFYNFAVLKLDNVIEDIIAFNTHSTNFFY